ncbi:MAG: hypothetical protein IT459_15090, partial [Planctomycetes bacterium]|nr:hypothetical protein [Planctomycetota bacterium]
MKPIAILASLLTLAAAQDVPQSTEADPSAEPTSTTSDAPPHAEGPLSSLVRDRSALFVDLAKTKHTPVRSRERDPFLVPAEQQAGKSLDSLEAERAEAARAERESAAKQAQSERESEAAT